MQHPLVSEVAGKVWKVIHQVGDTVQQGAEIMVIESMKMEFPVTAPAAGKIVSLSVAEGEAVTEDQSVGMVEA